MFFYPVNWQLFCVFYTSRSSPSAVPMARRATYVRLFLQGPWILSSIYYINSFVFLLWTLDNRCCLKWTEAATFPHNTLSRQLVNMIVHKNITPWPGQHSNLVHSSRYPNTLTPSYIWFMIYSLIFSNHYTKEIVHYCRGVYSSTGLKKSPSFLWKPSPNFYYCKEEKTSLGEAFKKCYEKILNLKNIHPWDADIYYIYSPSIMNWLRWITHNIKLYFNTS